MPQGRRKGRTVVKNLSALETLRDVEDSETRDLLTPTLTRAVGFDASTVIRRAALTADGNVVAILGNGETSPNARVGRMIVNSAISQRRDRVAETGATDAAAPEANWELFGHEDWLMYRRT